jgi:hypothetical protein
MMTRFGRMDRNMVEQKDGGQMFQIKSVNLGNGKSTLDYITNTREAAEREAVSMAEYFGIPKPEVVELR